MCMLQNGATTEQGKVLVADHIPKVKVFTVELTAHTVSCKLNMYCE